MHDVAIAGRVGVLVKHVQETFSLISAVSHVFRKKEAF